MRAAPILALIAYTLCISGVIASDVAPSHAPHGPRRMTLRQLSESESYSASGSETESDTSADESRRLSSPHRRLRADAPVAASMINNLPQKPAEDNEKPPLVVDDLAWATEESEVEQETARAPAPPAESSSESSTESSIDESTGEEEPEAGGRLLRGLAVSV